MVVQKGRKSMERPLKGDIVVVPLPFSDLKQYKKRPALVLSVLEGNDLILCQITSRQNKDPYVISLLQKDFDTGTLRQESNIRPNKLFTADKSIILYRAGSLAKQKLIEAIEKTCQIIRH